jgi:XTP/dITP diphosphohydrolase
MIVDSSSQKHVFTQDSIDEITMKITYATSNKGKVLSLRKILEPSGIEIEQVSLSIPEPRLDDVNSVAIFKIIFAYQELKRPVIVLDAGFFVHALNGFPKTNVNFALDTVNIEGILKLIEDKDRACEFRHTLAYMDGELSEPKLFPDIRPGTISKEPRGQLQAHNWSPLSLIFIPDGQKKTLAEMTPEEDQAWHASIAENSYYGQFRKWFLARNNK